MSHSTPPDCESKPTSTLPEQPGVLVFRKLHFLVRWSHWLNVPILLHLILSGISIYWASPIYQIPAIYFWMEIDSRWARCWPGHLSRYSESPNSLLGP